MKEITLEGKTGPTETRDATWKDYLDLVHEFPLVSIRDDAHLDQAISMIDRLSDKVQRSEGEEMYLGALTDLVETYEDAHVQIPPLSGVDVLRHLMEANDMTQNDLVPYMGTPSIVSEVLSGKRKLALSHIRRLAERFHVPADVFINP